MAVWVNGGQKPPLVFTIEKGKGNPRWPPPTPPPHTHTYTHTPPLRSSFCLVKLNANTQKADGLIPAQISGFCLGCCRYICPDKDQLHSTSTATVLLLLLLLLSLMLWSKRVRFLVWGGGKHGTRRWGIFETSSVWGQRSWRKEWQSSQWTHTRWLICSMVIWLIKCSKV